MPSPMYDSVDVNSYPADTQIAAGYVNGHWPTANDLPARFPGAEIVTIDVNGSRPDARVLDMEWGDATPDMCPPWAAAHGMDPEPVIYCSLSRVAEVLAAFGGVGKFRLWTGHYTGNAHICDKACGLPDEADGLVVATQWADPGTGSGGNYDVSLVADGWPVAPAAPAQQQQETDTDAATVNTNLGQALVWLDELESILNDADISIVGPPNTQALMSYLDKLAGDGSNLANAIRTALHAARKATGGE